MSVNNVPKALGLALVVACVTLLMSLNRIDPVAGAGLLGTALGYVAGNGIAARAGEPVTPVISSSNQHETDLHVAAKAVMEVLEERKEDS
jgi:hypothetical protein